MATHRKPLWYKDAVIYELHVRTFADSDADGIGDFRGLTSRLDYLQDLGVTALWLLPFYPSPLRDDGYDITDYRSVHPAYGTLEDFDAFLEAAHSRDLRVITELVLNHTSDQHPWFQRARRAPPGTPIRDFYVWSDTPKRYREARIIFKDFESSNWSWDPVAKAYYWHRFYGHQPDLNYESSEVRRVMTETLDFWLDRGVDGLRLDAVPYLFEREGTSCENLPETHAFLAELRSHIDAKYEHRMLLSEANQWPEDASAYFGNGAESHMAFHFPLMPRLFMALHMEDRYPLVDILQQTPAIPDSCQWAIFLRNHDELTLEMVTDEDRDYMYRVYAHDPQARINLGIRRRLAPLLNNNRRRIELMNALLMSLPGSPVLYYGDEIGMGDNIYLGDRNGVRNPMQWSGDRNAGFSRANPQRLCLPVIIDPEYHYESVNVEAQQQNRHSLLWWVKRILALRESFPALGRGDLELLPCDNRSIFAFTRRYDGEVVLVVANLSRYSQWVDLNLAAYRGRVPRELFGRIKFPPIDDTPYRLMLAPHAFYWFSLEVMGAVAVTQQAREVAVLDVPESLALAFAGRAAEELEAALPAYLEASGWLVASDRRLSTVHLEDVVPIAAGDSEMLLVLAEVSFYEGESAHLAMALAVERREPATTTPEGRQVVAKLTLAGGADGWLVDARLDGRLYEHLARLLETEGKVRGMAGNLVAVRSDAWNAVLGAAPHPAWHFEPLKVRQRNSSAVAGELAVLKVFRNLEDGTSIEQELGAHLSDRAHFAHAPPFLGSIEYRRRGQPPRGVAVLYGFVPHRGDAWTYTGDVVVDYYDAVLTRSELAGQVPAAAPVFGDLFGGVTVPAVHDLCGAYLVVAELLGRRVAELHAALSVDSGDPAFEPEPFTPFYQRSVYQSLRHLMGVTLERLRLVQAVLPAEEAQLAAELLGREGELRTQARSILGATVQAMRGRYHGDLHLGQVLWQDTDVVIIDFEGDPRRPQSERRIKRSPLRDIASMLCSFHQAAVVTLYKGKIRPMDVPVLRPWATAWVNEVGRAFVQSYVAASQGSLVVPTAPDEMRMLTKFFLLERMIYELDIDLRERPQWVRGSLDGLLALL